METLVNLLLYLTALKLQGGNESHLLQKKHLATMYAVCVSKWRILRSEHMATTTKVEAFSLQFAMFCFLVDKAAYLASLPKSFKWNHSRQLTSMELLLTSSLVKRMFGNKTWMFGNNDFPWSSGMWRPACGVILRMTPRAAESGFPTALLRLPPPAGLSPSVRPCPPHASTPYTSSSSS